MTVYQDIQLPTLSNRPYFFSNFVQTIDGRAVILPTNAYEPIGSLTDFATFIDLRKYADALIHGKRTAATHRTVETITKQEFLAKRNAKKKKNEVLPYYILTNHPDESLLPALINNPGQKPYIVTNEQAKIPKTIELLAHFVRIGKNEVDLPQLSTYFFEKGYHHILVEGGPTLMGNFFTHHIIDEIFLTIAPKIISGKQTEFLTMTEGHLIPPKHLDTWKLVSVKQAENELFLRYRKTS